MEMEIPPPGHAGSVASEREVDLEAKLSKRTMLLSLFIALSLAELLVMIELARQAS